MNSQLKKYIETWLFKADEDLLVVDRLLEYEIIAKGAIGFHCQQAAEKYLKAFLIFHGKDTLKTHNLEFLIVECSKIDKRYAALNPLNLTDFGVAARYPGDLIIPTEKEVFEFKEFALQVKKLVKSSILFLD